MLADAGLVCNQPVELLADSCGEGWLIASDLGGSGTAALEGLPDADSMSGWRAAVQRWQGINVPQLTTTLIRSMTLGDGDARARLDRLGRPFRTTWMQLPVDDVGFFGGESRQSAVIDRAQAHAQEVFDREIGPSST